VLLDAVCRRERSGGGAEPGGTFPLVDPDTFPDVTGQEWIARAAFAADTRVEPFLALRAFKFYFLVGRLLR